MPLDLLAICLRPQTLAYSKERSALIGIYLIIVPIAFVAINAWTIICFWDDKQSAIAGRRRIPEASLLQLALLGGTPGAFLAGHLFRHKTRKEPFSTRLQVIAAVQLGLLIGFAIW
ncbi:DUF1294 domain-containing protein [Croceicoccus marinus]|uniref:DUF1294 domain-containing protein n=1 Tax=Croceicoccus marinus TaxID=450378 RepID=UPI0009FC52D7